MTSSEVVHLPGKTTAAITGGTGACADSQVVLHSKPGTDTLVLH